MVPRHPTPAEPLLHYREQRARFHYAAWSDAFLVSERGALLTYPARYCWFGRLGRRLALEPTEGGRHPRLMSFRHPFAVSGMRRWYEPGQDVQALLPHRSVSWGHLRPQERYWYFTAVPERLGAAAQRVQAYALTGGPHDA